MLTCREVAEEADAYLDSESGIWTGIRILVHLKLCSSCRAFMQQMRQARSLAENVEFAGEFDAPDERIASVLFHLQKYKKEMGPGLLPGRD